MVPQKNQKEKDKSLNIWVKMLRVNSLVLSPQQDIYHHSPQGSVSITEEVAEILQELEDGKGAMEHCHLGRTRLLHSQTHSTCVYLPGMGCKHSIKDGAVAQGPHPSLLNYW